MIYEFPDKSSPIRQGDIFEMLPRAEISMERMIMATEYDERIVTWDEIVNSENPVKVIVSVRSVTAIVASQDCDLTREDDVCLCEIRPFRQVEGKSKETAKPKSWCNIITQQARINQKWFYLPPDPNIGFTDKMAVDFRVTINLPRLELEALRKFRKGRLNSIADEHFRERISEFYRRYPYNEWYSLNKEELDAYKKDHADIEPYSWQKVSS